MLEPVKRKPKYTILEQIKLIFWVITAKLFDLGDILSYHITICTRDSYLWKNVKYQISWYPLLLIFKNSGRATIN